MSTNLHREPVAWVNDYRMSGKCFAFVEGSSDEWFWKKFINKDCFIVIHVEGWPNVLECVKEFNNSGLSNFCFGIVDNDFEYIYPEKNIHEPNIFITDCHDIEMMMYSCADTINSAILSVDKKCTLKEAPNEVIKSVLNITDNIGYLKLASKMYKLNLIFCNETSHEIKLPDYGNIIDNKGNYIDDNQLVNYIRDYSNSNKRKTAPLPDSSTILNKLSMVKQNKYDSSQLSNGHDVSCLLPIILRKKYKTSGSHISSDTIEIALCAAYDQSELKNTQLYKSMINWAAANELKVFNFD